MQDAGPYEDQYDLEAAPGICSLAYQPLAMRFRGVSVLTNTPPRTSQRSPGGMQQNAIMEPILAAAARQLGVDSVALHRINAPAGKAPIGPPTKDGTRGYVTSAFVREALDHGAALFRWDERKARSRVRRGAAVRGVGVAVSPVHRRLLHRLRRPAHHPARRQALRAVGRRQPRARTRSSTRRASRPTVLGVAWDDVTVVWGDTSKHLPWSCTSDGSQTIHAMARANHAAAHDAVGKLQALAAADLGGAPDRLPRRRRPRVPRGVAGAAV